MKTVTVEMMDKEEFNYCLDSLNLVHNYVTRPLPLNMTEEKAAQYYEGIFAQYRDAKVLEHSLRCRFAEKYKVPYAFGYDNGVLSYEELEA